MPKIPKRKDRGVVERPSGSSIWWIDYYADGKRKREKVGRKSDAIKLYQKRRTEILQGIKLPENIRKARVFFKELAESALTFSANHHRDTRNVKSRIAKIVSAFGGRIAESIRPAEIDNWISENTKTASTANRYRAVFSLVYREGMANEKVKANPARLVRQRPENNIRIRYLRDDEELRLRAAIRNKFPEHEDELTVSVGTGIRLNDQYTMRWSQVDFDRKEIFIPRPKNDEARYVPMNADVEKVLWKLHDASEDQSENPVFPIKNPRKWFATALRDANIEHYRWHDNRHTFCSRLVMAGIGLKTVQLLAGHKTISITARYAHLAPNALHAAVQLLSGKLRKKCRSSRNPARRNKPPHKASRVSLQTKTRRLAR